MKFKNKKSQNFSFDLIISIVIFIAIIAVLFFIMRQSFSNPKQQLVADANNLYNQISTSSVSGGLSIFDSNGITIDRSKLLQLAVDSIKNYTGLKRRLGVVNDFCIVLINNAKDSIWPIQFNKQTTVKLENGTTLDIPKNSVMYGIGSPKVIINGSKYPCGNVYNVSDKGVLTLIYNASRRFN